MASASKLLATDEPDERIAHIRVCGGSGGKPLLLPGSWPGAARLRQRAAKSGKHWSWKAFGATNAAGQL